MSENKIGDVIVIKNDTEQRAFYGLADGSSTFLCAIALDDYENPLLRQRFFELATETVVERIRAAGSDVRLVERGPAPPPQANPSAGSPCWACKSPMADDVRSLLSLGSASDIRLSPSGLPVNCCRVTTVGAFGSGTR